jgi:hypothetical protein
MIDPQPLDPLAAFLGQEVVLDTQGPLVYIGRLLDIGPAFLTLADADVHDTNDSRASKDLYILESRTLGIHVNRSRVAVARAQVASISFLRDVAD